MQPNRHWTRPLRRGTHLLGAAVIGLGLLTSTAAPATAHGRHLRCASAATVLSWDATAAAALATDAQQGPPTMAVGMAYVQAAVYNAVVGTDREGHLYRWRASAPHGASTDAAVAAASRGVLLHYFPVSSARVEAQYADTLAGIPDGRAKTAGVSFGERAARHLIAQRRDDGWLAPISYTVPPAPGVWRPTPPALAPYVAPWLGAMKPFTLRSSQQLRPGPPPSLSSRRYGRDLREVESMGSTTSTTRTAEQTEIAKFFAGNLSDQLQGAYRDHVQRHGLCATGAARYLAVATLAGADGVITAWDSKAVYHRWRPITAIQSADSDDNPCTTADPAWTPLLATPPHPDYLSGHTTVIGAVTRALKKLDGTSVIDLNLTSAVTGTTRHYELARTLRDEGIGARIWGGIHTRTADEVGDHVGRRVGAQVARTFD